MDPAALPGANLRSAFLPSQVKGISREISPRPGRGPKQGWGRQGSFGVGSQSPRPDGPSTELGGGVLQQTRKDTVKGVTPGLPTHPLRIAGAVSWPSSNWAVLTGAAVGPEEARPAAADPRANADLPLLAGVGAQAEGCGESGGGGAGEGTVSSPPQGAQSISTAAALVSPEGAILQLCPALRRSPGQKEPRRTGVPPCLAFALPPAPKSRLGWRRRRVCKQEDPRTESNSPRGHSGPTCFHPGQQTRAGGRLAGERPPLARESGSPTLAITARATGPHRHPDRTVLGGATRLLP